MNIPEPDLNSPTWPFVLAFAKRMEAKLAKNRHKGDREGWLDMEPGDILSRVLDENVELGEALRSWYHVSSGSKEVADECADVANFCMMLADRVSYERPAA